MAGRNLVYHSARSCVEPCGTERQKCEISLLLSQSDETVNTEGFDRIGLCTIGKFFL